MALQIHAPSDEVIGRLRDAIEAAFENAQIEVRGGGGHFEISVVSAQFEGEKVLARQRRVYRAIAHLMDGDAAPVHAIDKLDTRVP